jgi:deoxycytidine triphosphate deaminase
VILTDREIKLAILNRLIIIEPTPDEKAFSSTAVDLTLDENISEFKEGGTGGLSRLSIQATKIFSPRRP